MEVNKPRSAWPFMLLGVLLLLSLAAASKWRLREHRVAAPHEVLPGNTRDRHVATDSPRRPDSPRRRPDSPRRHAPRIDVAVRPSPAASSDAPLRTAETQTQQPAIVEPRNRSGNAPAPSLVAGDELPRVPSAIAVDLPPRATAPSSPDGPEEPVARVAVAPSAQRRTGSTGGIVGPKSLGRPTDRSNASVDPARWALADELTARLHRIRDEPACLDWANRVAQSLSRLTECPADGTVETSERLGELRAALGDVNRIVAGMENRDVEVQVRRAHHAVLRRLGIWSRASSIGQSDQPVVAELPAESAMLASLDGVDGWTRQISGGQQWRRYLLLDALREAADQPDARELPPRRLLARQAIGRLQHAEQAFRGRNDHAGDGQLQMLASHLRQIAAEPVDARSLFANLEAYEQTGAASLARRLAEDRTRLAFSPSDEARQLARHIEVHYRNANIRVAVADELARRLLPQPPITEDPVAETIAGADVYGRRQTATSLRVRMVPDQDRIRMALVADGVIHSRTYSSSGPATVYNDGVATYSASKTVTIGREGVRTGPAQAYAESRATLADLETTLDAVPLVRSLVRSVVRDQFQKRRGQAAAEVEARVEHQAREQLDERANVELANLARRADEIVVQPLEELGLQPMAIRLRTTDRRAIARYRLAGNSQLGSNTPRPTAASDSLLSVQIHQTALNNVLEGLKLDGRTFQLRDLYRTVADRLGVEQLQTPDDIPDDVTITFADRDAVAVRIEEGVARVTLRIAEIDTGRRRWRDMIVHADYEPRVEGLHAELARERTISLGGERLTLGSRVALRAIFTKLFSKNRPLQILPEKFAARPQVADLMVNQFVLIDGWIGFAVGPKRTAVR